MKRASAIRPQFVILWGALLTGAANSLFLQLPRYIGDYWGDWPIFWEAAHLPDYLYRNFELLKFPYPPTALLVLYPFGLLPIWPGLWLWSVAGLLALYSAGRLIASPRTVVAAFAMPACLWCVLVGQTGLFIAALTIAAVACRSGWLFGMGLVLKPHCLAALPFTKWNAGLAARAFCSASAMIILSVFAFGWRLWPDWAASLDDFQSALALPRIRMLNAGMTGLIHNFGLAQWLYYPGAALGALSTWVVFRATEDHLERYAALACGSVLISPYTLGYDLAGLSIAALAMLLDPRRSIPRWIATGWIVSGTLPAIGVLGLAAVQYWEHRKAWRGEAPDLTPP